MVLPGSPNVRSTDPDTSHEAADLTDTAASRIEVLRILDEEGPLSHEVLVSHHNLRFWTGLTGKHFTPQRMRTACHELVEDGVVVEAGESRTIAGRRCKKWALAPTWTFIQK